MNHNKKFKSKALENGLCLCFRFLLQIHLWLGHLWAYFRQTNNCYKYPIHKCPVHKCLGYKCTFTLKTRLASFLHKKCIISWQMAGLNSEIDVWVGAWHTPFTCSTLNKHLTNRTSSMSTVGITTITVPPVLRAGLASASSLRTRLFVIPEHKLSIVLTLEGNWEIGAPFTHANAPCAS